MRKYSSKTYEPRMLTTRKVTNPFWINVFKAYENLSDRIEVSSASELLIELFFITSLRVTTTTKKCFILRNEQVGTYFWIRSFRKKI